MIYAALLGMLSSRTVHSLPDHIEMGRIGTRDEQARFKRATPTRNSVERRMKRARNRSSVALPLFQERQAR